MKRSSLVHSTWALLCIGAFIAGNTLQLERKEAKATVPTKPLRSERDGTESSSTSGSKKITGLGGVSFRPGEALAPQRMEATIQSVVKVTDPTTRDRLFLGILECLSPENARSAVAAFLDARGGAALHDPWFRRLVYRWGELDGEAAATFARQLKARARRFALAYAFEGWASMRPAEAEQALEGLDWSDGYIATRGFVRGLAPHDPAYATDFLLRLRETAESDDSKSRSWPYEFLDDIAKLQFQSDPEEAIRWGESIPDDILRRRALMCLAAEYARVDPAASFDWATSLQHEPSVIPAAMEAWTNQDRRSAKAKLLSMDEGEDRDAAIWGYVMATRDNSPASALELAAMMTDPFILKATYEQWHERDPSSAREWLANSSLSSVLREQLEDTGNGDTSGGPH